MMSSVLVWFLRVTYNGFFFFQKKYAIDVIEYYDDINNRGAVYQTGHGKPDLIWIYDFENVESFKINGKIASIYYYIII